MRALLAGLVLCVAVAAPSPATAKCDPETGHDCSSECDAVEARYDAALAKYVGDGAPPFPLMCPQH